MSSKHQKLQLFFGFVMLLCISAGVIYLLILLIDYIKGLKSENSVALIIGSLTIATSIFANIVIKHYEKKNAVEISLRESRKEVYNSYLSLMQRALANVENDVIDPEKVAEINKGILLWTSDRTLKMVGELRNSLINNPQSTKENLEKYAKIVLAMRADLGYKNKDLKPKDLLNVFINDVDKYFD